MQPQILLQPARSDRPGGTGEDRAPVGQGGEGRRHRAAGDVAQLGGKGAPGFRRGR